MKNMKTKHVRKVSEKVLEKCIFIYTSMHKGKEKPKKKRKLITLNN